MIEPHYTKDDKYAKAGTEPTLPPLPYTDLSLSIDGGEPYGSGYTADDMRSYATAAVLAERERCARIAEDIDDEYYGGSDIAAAIRKAE